MNKTNRRGFSGLSELASDIESFPSTGDQPISPETALSEKQVFDLLDMTELPTCPMPWSSTNDGETWVWGDFFFLFEKNPKPAFEKALEELGKELEKSGQNIEWSGLIFHYSMSVFYRIDRNPHGPLQKPIMSVTLEQADSNMPLEVQRGLESETPQSRESKKEEPMKITLFSGRTERDLGEYDGDFNPVAVKRRFFEILKEELGVQGQPKMIGDLEKAFGHPETGLPPNNSIPVDSECNKEKRRARGKLHLAILSLLPIILFGIIYNYSHNTSSLDAKVAAKKSRDEYVNAVMSDKTTGKEFDEYMKALMAGKPAGKGKNSDLSLKNEAPDIAPISTERGLEFKKPRGGKNNLLSVQEIRWCIREDIRIEAMRGIVETNKEIIEFNKMVDDYNNRCGSYRFYPDSRKKAEQDINPIRELIIAEAISKVKQWGNTNNYSTSNASTSSKKLSKKEIKEIQELLIDLGFAPGPVDGKYGSRTAQAVKAFQRSQGITQNGILDQGLLKLLRRKNDSLSPKK